MLIRFTAENFLSFHQRIDFNMIASKESSHPHHVIRGNGRADIDLLKSSVIYGANASGKSNLIKAMAFAKDLIVKGVEKNKNIDPTPFKLDKDCYQKPSRFEFEFRRKGRQYAYGFSVDKSKVHEEWLFEIGLEREAAIFERYMEKISFDFAHDIYSRTSQKEKTRIEYEAASTRRNLLFLTNCRERNIQEFDEVYEWFDDVLSIVFPHSQFGILPLFLDSDKEFQNEFYQIMKRFDFRIKRIGVEEIDFDNLSEIPKEVKDNIEETFPYDRDANAILASDTFLYNIKEGKKGLTALRLVIIREDKEGEDVRFELSEESDGTQRIIHLIPMLMKYQRGESVFVMDEVENSLHVVLIKKLFDFMLNHKIFKASSGQIICSTHEVNLLDIKTLFRKDEIWFIEKNKNGESVPYSLADAEVEGLDLVKGYLNGRFGALPFIPDIREMGWEG